MEFEKMKDVELRDVVEAGIKKARGIAGLYSAAASSDHEMDRDTLVCASWALESELIDVDQAYQELRQRTDARE